MNCSRLVRLAMYSLTLVCFLIASPGIAEEATAEASAAPADGEVVVDADGFTPLFDGETLDGWVVRGGGANYEVEPEAEGGAQIVGISFAGAYNTFLCTEKDYEDFVLEFEVKVDPALNSGVQFRSNVMTQATRVTTTDSAGVSEDVMTPAGQVYGYQVEIDPTTRAWSGGIYDEGRRGWIYNLKGDKHDRARAAFKQGEWNHYRVEAVGDSIKTFVNDVPVTDLTDSLTSSGFVALQVHSIFNPNADGKEIRWRNVRIKEQ